MKKNFLYLTISAFLFLWGISLNAETLTNQESTATWAFNTGLSGQTATFSDNTGNYFNSNYASIGTGLLLKGTNHPATTTTMVQTLIQPTVSNESSANDGNLISFIIKPKTGLTFTPTKISFNTTRYGTDGGKLDVSWLNADGTKVSLGTGISPNRNNKTPDYTAAAYDVTGAKASSGECGLLINLYSLGNTKQIGFSDIVITGYLNGEMANITSYTLNTSTNPADAGTVSVSPVGTTFDENTEVTLSQTRNFGYKFTKWTDESGTTLSTDENYKFKITANTNIVANYEAIQTYALTYNLTGGANSYMITATPAPHVVSDANMYEEGTTVVLTAASNPILTFTSWSTGETTKDLTLTMDKNQTVTANYDAVDYLAGWDFYLAGGKERIADFSSADNTMATFSLRNADGTTTGWLDKSYAAGGYEGKYCAIAWTPFDNSATPASQYYYQTSVNASAFKNIKVSASMMYSYYAYQKQHVDYSLDGSTWTTIGTMDLSTAPKTWVDSTFTLPSAADNQPAVYIRWIPDYTSAINGSASTKDGTSITNVFITGDVKYVDDGTAPKMESSTPADEAKNQPTSGNIIFTFDEKVQLKEGTTASLYLAPQQSSSTAIATITPTVIGKTLKIHYNGLAYATKYTVSIPANSIADMGNNYMTDAITLNFTTKDHATITKGAYDFIVPDNGTLPDAIAAAAKRADTSVRYRIFVKKGSYQLTGDAGATISKDGNGNDITPVQSPVTTIGTPNVSIIGEDEANTTIWNLPTIEGIGVTATFFLSNAATGTYMQDITLKNAYPYNSTTGRAVCLQDKSNKTICKNVKMLSYQDTYYSNNNSSRFYFEDSEIHGVVDFLCGGGDVYYNRCLLYLEKRSGNCICAPGTPYNYGYVFRDCTVDGDASDNGDFTIGRPWGSDVRAQYINTTMNILPSAIGWSEMSGGYPKLFAEYNSTTSKGGTVDLSGRKRSWTDKSGGTHSNDPVLTADKAAMLSISKVMGGDDDWDPTYYTEQANAPQNITFKDGTVTWDKSDYVFCYAICKNGNVIAFTDDNTYTLPADATASDLFTVRAANEYGGLGEASSTFTTGIENSTYNKVVTTSYYNVQGMKLLRPSKGVNIKVERNANGSVKSSKVMVD